MEYDRITKAKFKSREEVKFNLLSISSAIDAVKQNIKDEGKAQRYNKVIKIAEDLDVKIQTEEYTDEDYKELFTCVDEYVGYINDNYDISKLPTDERELIEFVIETMINGIESDIDKHLYEYNLIINICKNSYRYFKIIDKIFEKLQNIYDESLEKDIIAIQDYIKMYKEIYDLKIKTMVNDVHRAIKTEDEYLEYSKLAAGEDEEALNKFILQRALELTKSDVVKEKIKSELGQDEEVIEEENIIEKIDLDESDNDEEEKSENAIDKVRIGITKTIRKVGRPKKKVEVEEVKEKRRRGRPSKKEKVVEAK